MAVVFALMAAAVFGIAVAVQHHVAAATDRRDQLHPRLLLRLIRRPLWLAGLGGDVIGWTLQTIALAMGSLVVVQPVMTLNLVVALMLAARLSHRHVDGREWLAVSGATLGLVAFLRVADPTSHSDASPSMRRWLIAGSVMLVAILIGAVVGRFSTGIRQAATLAVATAGAEAVMAVVSKSFGDRVGHHHLGVFLSWEPYVLIVCGIATVILVQSTFQLDRPTVTLPILAVVEPLTATTLGLVLFHERLHAAGVRGLAVLAAVATMMISLGLARERSTRP